MKAVRVPAFGGPEVLAWADAEEPEPQAGQVAIEVRLCGLQPWPTCCNARGLSGRSAPVVPGRPGGGRYRGGAGPRRD